MHAVQRRVSGRQFPVVDRSAWTERVLGGTALHIVAFQWALRSALLCLAGLRKVGSMVFSWVSEAAVDTKFISLNFAHNFIFL